MSLIRSTERKVDSLGVRVTDVQTEIGKNQGGKGTGLGLSLVRQSEEHALP